MIFPLVIGTVMAIFYIVLALYQRLDLQASLHAHLRQEAGIRSGTVYRVAETKSHSVEEGFVKGKAVIRAEEEQCYRRNSLFLHPVSTVEGGRTYVIDEADLVRKMNFTTGLSEVLP